MVSQKSQNVAMVYILIMFWSCDFPQSFVSQDLQYRLGVCLVCQKRNKEST